MTTTTCELCGAPLPPNTTCRQLYDQLAFYTLAHQDQQYFIHQLIVDAYGAQHIAASTKPVAVFSTLVGLYLFSECGCSGKEVQDAHRRFGNSMKAFKRSGLPAGKAAMNIAMVLRVPEGQQRDEAIKQWAREVWHSWQGERDQVISFYKLLLKS